MVRKANQTSFKKGHKYIPNNGKLKGKHNSPRINISHKIFCEYHNIECVPKGFVIHHIDENKDNNLIENLMLLSKSEHSKLHAKRLKS